MTSRFVTVTAPSFPDVAFDESLTPRPAVRWQVLCGDPDHWRAGLYCPPESSLADVGELERHTCPELFLLLRGRLILVLADGGGGVRELELEPGKPVIVTSPHTAYCPDGPYTGEAFVVERDLFGTEYRRPADW